MSISRSGSTSSLASRRSPAGGLSADASVGAGARLLASRVGASWALVFQFCGGAFGESLGDGFQSLTDEDRVRMGPLEQLVPLRGCEVGPALAHRLDARRDHRRGRQKPVRDDGDQAVRLLLLHAPLFRHPHPLALGVPSALIVRRGATMSVN